MALAISPNAPLYGGKQPSLAEAMLELPKSQNEGGSREVMEMTRDDFEKKFPMGTDNRWKYEHMVLVRVERVRLLAKYAIKIQWGLRCKLEKKA